MLNVKGAALLNPHEQEIPNLGEKNLFRSSVRIAFVMVLL